MTYEATHAAIEARLLDGWTLTPVMVDGGTMVDPVSRETVLQPNTDPWLRLTVQEASELPVGKGSKTLWRTAGRIVVDVFTVEANARQGRALADQVAALFRGQAFGGVICSEALIRGVGARDGWYQTQVACVYRADFEA